MKNVLLFSLLASLFLLANGCVNDPYYNDGYYDSPRGHRPPPPKPDHRPAPPAHRPEARPPQQPAHRPEARPQQPAHRPAPAPSHDAPRPEPRHRT